MEKAVHCAAGTLSLVATPIGNLADISERARQVLQQADLIAAEDSRHSRKLLGHCAIDRPLLSYHDHSPPARRRQILQRLLDGANIALISDAGTPLIADPGYRLVREARELGIEVAVVPGPCAVIAALCGCGLPCDRFCFEGFLPPLAGARRRRLERLRGERRTMVFYEAPRRVRACLDDMARAFGARRAAALAREMTKRHEQWLAGDLQQLGQRMQAQGCRGEFVLVVAGAGDDAPAQTCAQAEILLHELMAELPPARAVRLAARISGQPRAQLYEMAMRLQRG